MFQGNLLKFMNHKFLDSIRYAVPNFFRTSEKYRETGKHLYETSIPHRERILPLYSNSDIFYDKNR